MGPAGGRGAAGFRDPPCHREKQGRPAGHGAAGQDLRLHRVRQLEGTINKILAYKDLLGNDTDEETVTRAIQDMLRRSNEYVPTPEAILEYISKYYNLDEAVIRGQQRVRDAVSARQIAMYLIRSMTNLSLDEIGKVFDNRDHSTVLYSIQQIEKKMKKDASFAEMVKEIKTNINSKR